MNRGLETSLAEGLYIEASLSTQCVATEDRKEGAAVPRKTQAEIPRPVTERAPFHALDSFE